MDGRRTRRSVGLLMLDVDDFKHVNTVYGHPGGDRALVFVAGCLRKSCRAGDLPARLGGDEFAVLVRGADPDGMAALAERLLDAVRLGNSVRISVGWAIGAPAATAAARRRHRARRGQARRQGPRAQRAE